MMWPSDAVQPGTRVRLKQNPARTGVVGNELDGSSVRLRALVLFSDGNEEFVLLTALEPLPHGPLKPYALMQQGRYGRSQDLRAAITFHRLSGRLANLIYSLNTTNTQFMPHQFKPVLNFLDSPAAGLLIADEVGLGKTIEAGLIWTELKARYDARRLLVICPAMLREKWRDELANRFGTKADIVDAHELAVRLKHAAERPYEDFALIASMQGLRPPRTSGRTKSGAAILADLLEDFEAEEPLLHLTVIDEAHYLRNEETQTAKLGKLIRPVSEHLIMLSATPIQMRSRDLFNLVHLLDDDAFPYESSFDEILEANAPLLRLRNLVLSGKATASDFLLELLLPLSHPLFHANTQLQFLSDNSPTDEQLKDRKYCAELAELLDRINPLAKVINRTLKREVTELRVVREPVQRIAQMTPVEQQFYECITDTIYDYCEQEGIPIGFMLTIPQRQLSSSMAAACRRWQRQGGMSDLEIELGETASETLDDVLWSNNGRKDDAGPLLSQLMSIATSQGNFAALRRHDAKYELLRNDLLSYRSNHPGTKIVLFAFYTETLHYLAERLREDQITSVVLHGSMDKNAIIKRFAEDASITILLSSEVASEGVDLQFSGVVINYDMPWNPMRIEQRIGRIDRIGQEQPKILIWNYLYADTIDERVYAKLLVRLDIFRHALGMMEGILGEEIRALTIDLITHRLTPEQEEERINQTAQALENIERQQRNLEEEAAQLIAHGDYILNKVKAANELGRYITGRDLLVYVDDFLKSSYPNSRLKRVNDQKLVYSCELETEARAHFGDYLERMHMKGRTRLLSHSPLTLEFDNQVGGKHDRVERVTQEHPLVRFVTECRQRLDQTSRPYPVSAVRISGHTVASIEPGDYAYCISRWSLTGAQDTERLVYRAHRLGGNVLEDTLAELLINSAGINGGDLLGAANKLDNAAVATLFEQCQTGLESDFIAYQAGMQRENHDRLQWMINLLQKRKERQGQLLRSRIEDHQHSGIPAKLRLVAAEKGKLRKLEQRIDQRISELKLREELQVNESFVAGGIVRVE